MRKVLVGTAAAAMVLSGGAASAAEDPAAGGDDGWTPVPEEYWAPFDLEVCGSTVTITGGDVREAEVRTEVLDDGSTLTEYRGGQTVDITASPTARRSTSSTSPARPGSWCRPTGPRCSSSSRARRSSGP